MTSYWFTDEDEDLGWGGPTFASVAAMNETARANQLAAANRAYEESAAAAAVRDPRYTFSPGTTFEGSRDGGYERYVSPLYQDNPQLMEDSRLFSQDLINQYNPRTIGSTEEQAILDQAEQDKIDARAKQIADEELRKEQERLAKEKRARDFPYATFVEQALAEGSAVEQKAFRDAINKVHEQWSTGTANPFNMTEAQRANPLSDLSWLDHEAAKSAFRTMATNDLKTYGFNQSPQSFAAVAMMSLAGWDGSSLGGNNPPGAIDNSAVQSFMRRYNITGNPSRVVPASVGASYAGEGKQGLGGAFSGLDFGAAGDSAGANGFKPDLGTFQNWPWMNPQARSGDPFDPRTNLSADEDFPGFGSNWGYPSIGSSPGTARGDFGKYPSEWGNVYQAFGPSSGNPYTSRAWGAMQQPTIDRFTMGLGLGDIDPKTTFAQWLPTINPMDTSGMANQLSRVSSLLQKDPLAHGWGGMSDRELAFQNYMADPTRQISMATNYGKSQLPAWLRDPYESSMANRANRWMTGTGGSGDFLRQFTQRF